MTVQELAIDVWENASAWWLVAIATASIADLWVGFIALALFLLVHLL
jgi:hypothetical protein